MTHLGYSVCRGKGARAGVVGSSLALKTLGEPGEEKNLGVCGKAEHLVVWKGGMLSQDSVYNREETQAKAISACPSLEASC